MTSQIRKTVRPALGAILLVLVFSANSYANSYFPASPWTKQRPYFEKISHKLGFGLLNVLTGWDALFFEPVLNDNMWAGLGKALIYPVTNTAGGAIHALTFPIPVDVPLPEGGVRFERT